MGKQVDEGNVDYLRERTCGGLPWTLITPTSIPEVKQLMSESGIPTRDARQQARLDSVPRGGAA